MFNFNRNFPYYFVIPFIILLLLLAYSWYVTKNITYIPLENGCDEKKAWFIKSQINDTRHRISYCENGDKDTMEIKSAYMDSPKYIAFDFIGYPGRLQNTIYLEDKNLNTYLIPKIKERGSIWQNIVIKVPDNMKGKIRIVAGDASIEKYGYLGIGNIVAEERFENFNLTIYIKSILYSILFALFISVIFGYFLKYTQPLKSFIYMSLFVGLSAYILFFTYLLSVDIGKLVSLLLLFGIGLTLFKLNWKRLQLATLVFSILTSLILIIVFIGYCEVEDMMNFQSISANRWRTFPVDNWIPKFFADAILREDIKSPLFGSWYSSDRPPLQTGFFLIFSIFSSSHLMYFIVSVGMQLLVIVFICMLLLEYIKDKYFIFFVMLLIFFNGFVFVNSLFVWPKLLSSLYQGIAFYYLYDIWSNKHSSIKSYTLFGLSSSLAFLSHGGAVFYLLALSILLLFTIKSKTSAYRLGTGFLVAVVVYIPWILYQKLMDPPGDRLVKWHLANKTEITDETFIEVISTYYEKLYFSDWIVLQLSNIEKIFHSFYLDMFNVSMLESKQIIANIFFSLDYSFLSFSIFLSILYFFSNVKVMDIKSFVLLLLSSYVIYNITWSFLLTSGTILHHGAYFSWFSGFIAVTIIVYYTNKYIFILLSIVNLIIFFTVYISPYLFNRDLFSSLIVVTMMLNFTLILFHFMRLNDVNVEYMKRPTYESEVI